MSAAPPPSRGDAATLPSHLRHPGSVIAKWFCVTFTVLFLSAMIILPAMNVFRQAFGIPWERLKHPIDAAKLVVSEGVPNYVKTFYIPERDTKDLPRAEARAYRSARASAEETRGAIAMTLGVVAIAVPLNVFFGLTAAWAISKFRFRGRTMMISLIDLPFAVSPVVAGLIFVLLFGRVGYFGNLAQTFNWPMPLSASWVGFDTSWWPIAFGNWQQGIIFTPLAIVIATTFITFPFVARSLIPLMETQGVDQEQAALTLGASGRQMFWRVTLPQIKWALLYGIILCTARAVGEFGAVSVVAGTSNANDTMPLKIEKFWQGYQTQSAFAVASLLTGISILTLLLKIIIERRTSQQIAEAKESK